MPVCVLLATIVAWLLLAGSLFAETRTGTCIDVLWPGADVIREEDTPKLIAAGFDLFASQITSKVLDPPVGGAKNIEARWLDTCKAANAQVLVIPNALTGPQYKTLVGLYPGTVVGYLLADDAHTKTPAEINAALAAITPNLAGTWPWITVGKGTAHATYGPLLGAAGGYHVQNYIGKAAAPGPDGMRKYAYDEMLLARANVPGKLWGTAYLGKNPTPYFARRDPVYRAHEYGLPSVQEAVIWLQLIAGADGILYYTAYSIDVNNPLSEYRIGERWDLLPAYKSINARVKSLDSFLTGVGVVKARSVVGNVVTGTWAKPAGEVLTVKVDLATEFHPRVTWDIDVPIPAVMLKVTSDGKTISVGSP